MRTSTLPALLALTTLTLAQDAAPTDGFPPVVLTETDAMDPTVVELLGELADDVRQDPTNGNAHAELGLAYEANTMWSLAEEQYDHAIALLPERLEWRYRRGVMRYNNGDAVGAEEDFAAAAAVLKGTAVIQARHGDVLRLLGRLEEAQAAWERAIESEDRLGGEIKFAQSRVGLAQVLLDLEEFERAAALCTEALQLSPGYKHAHYTRGLALLELGKDDEAKVDLQLGLQAYPEFPPDPHGAKLADYGRGYNRRMMGIENMLQAGDIAGATATLDEILGERGEDPYVLNLAARAATMRGDLAGATTLLDRSLAADGEMANTYTEYTILLINQMAPLQQQIAMMQQQGADTSALETQLTQLDTAAREKAQKALELAPQHGRTHYYAGIVQMQTAGQDPQKLQQAKASFMAALRLGCTESNFYRNLAQLLLMMGDRQGVKYAELAVERAPGDVQTIDLLIRAYMTAGQQDKLGEAGAKLAAAAPQDPGALQMAIRCHLTVGDLDSAEALVTDLEKVGRAYPDAMQFAANVRQHITQQRAAGGQPPAPAQNGGGQ